MTALARPGDGLISALAQELRRGGLDVAVTHGPPPTGDQLVLALTLPGQPHEEPARVTALLLPGADDPLLLQAAAVLHEQVGSERAGELARAVCLVNASLPVGGFDYEEGSGVLLFRHLQPVQFPGTSVVVVAWSLSITLSAVAAYGGLLCDVVAGLAFDEVADRAQTIGAAWER